MSWEQRMADKAKARRISAPEADQLWLKIARALEPERFSPTPTTRLPCRCEWEWKPMNAASPILGYAWFKVSDDKCDICRDWVWMAA